MLLPPLTVGEEGVIASGASTCTVVVALWPRAETETTSATPLVAPAVYAPPVVIEPPERLVASVQLADPTEVENVTCPPALVCGLAGVMVSPEKTATCAVAVLPP